MSADLNRIEMGCYSGNHKINHLMFADDLCCFAPSIQSLRKQVRICEKYALGHVINFNPDKTVGMYFPFPFLKLNIQPTVSISGSSIKFVSDTKYLGVYLNQRAKDDQDILRQVRYQYCAANTARSKFHRCSNDIKTLVFRTYCMPMYYAHLWCNYHQSSYIKIRVAYNNAFCVLHGIPRCVGARLHQINANVTHNL